jgi:hypothetical protein
VCKITEEALRFMWNHAFGRPEDTLAARQAKGEISDDDLEVAIGRLARGEC